MLCGVQASPYIVHADYVESNHAMTKMDGGVEWHVESALVWAERTNNLWFID